MVVVEVSAAVTAVLRGGFKVPTRRRGGDSGEQIGEKESERVGGMCLEAACTSKVVARGVLGTRGSVDRWFAVSRGRSRSRCRDR